MKAKKPASKYCLHPWHGVDPGPDPPRIVNAVIEVPSNSKAKYEVHKPSGMIMLDRYLDSAAFYPANYGFIPQTWEQNVSPDASGLYVFTSSGRAMTIPSMFAI